jgi:hypothetical protein
MRAKRQSVQKNGEIGEGKKGRRRIIYSAWGEVPLCSVNMARSTSNKERQDSGVDPGVG